jgi:hypothetical protein
MIDDEVPLALYAAVVAALGEGYPLSVVLEHEGLSQDTWEAAEERWVDRLGASAEGDLSLFDALDRALATARARFARPVDPLDDDLDQFLAFKSHLAAAEKPIALLAKHGLFLGDWVRLQEHWAEKLATDSALRTKAARVLRAPEAPPLPLVRPGPQALPPPLRPRPAAPVVVTTVSSDAAEPVEWGLSIFRDTPRIHDVQHIATDERPAPLAGESPVVTSPLENSTPGPHREIDTEAASLAITGELPAYAHPLRAMADNPLPFRPGASSMAVPVLPPEAEAAIRAIPEGISGDTTLPIPPLEEIRAATRAPLPFKMGAPSNAQTPAQPRAVGSRVSPASATLPPPPLESTPERPLPFKLPEEPVAAIGREQIASAPTPVQGVGMTPALTETADLTKLVREVRERIGKSLPFADVGTANEPTSLPTYPQPNPPLPPAAKPPHALEITADVTVTVQELLRKSTEGLLPFSSPATLSPREPIPLPESAGSPSRAGGPPPVSGLDPDDMPTLQRPYAKAPESPGPIATQEQPSLTLEQYAQICIQLMQEPTRAVEIRARYGLADDSAWAIVHRRWQDRINRDPDLLRRWMELTAPI